MPLGKSAAYSPGGELASYTQYDDAVMSIVYESVSSNSLWTLFDEDFQSSVEFLTVPGRGLFWNADGATEPVGDDESPGVIFQRGDWTYTIKRIPYLRAEFWDHQGKVNETSIESPKYEISFTAGKLLYEGVVTTNSINYLGEQEFRAELKFAYNSLGWNNFPRAGHQKADGSPELLPMYDSTPKQYKPYAVAELKDLLLTT